MSDAGILRCPSCGAPTGPEDAACAHCAAPLHPIRCPWCFGWTYTETRDCAHCGSTAQAPAEGVSPSCPSCRVPLSSRVLGRARLAGCARCAGVWADAESFKTICADNETQSTYLGDGSILPSPPVGDPQASPIVYRPCAVCGELMNRFNFAGSSGVILDSCRSHGVWFDPDELRHIIAFIRGGGLDLARVKERHDLELERHRLELATADSEHWSSALQPPVPATITASRDLLRFFLD